MQRLTLKPRGLCRVKGFIRMVLHIVLLSVVFFLSMKPYCCLLIMTCVLNCLSQIADAIPLTPSVLLHFLSLIQCLFISALFTSPLKSAPIITDHSPLEYIGLWALHGWEYREKHLEHTAQHNKEHIQTEAFKIQHDLNREMRQKH